MKDTLLNILRWENDTFVALKGVPRIDMAGLLDKLGFTAERMRDLEGEFPIKDWLYSEDLAPKFSGLSDSTALFGLGLAANTVF